MSNRAALVNDVICYDPDVWPAFKQGLTRIGLVAQGPPKAIRYSNTRFIGAAASAVGTPGSSSSGSAAGGSVRSHGVQPCPPPSADDALQTLLGRLRMLPGPWHDVLTPGKVRSLTSAASACQ
jgi:hypothetical protein